jgi:uncharacterized protein (UPF0248 family)
MTLSQATTALKRAHCPLGTVTRPKKIPHHRTLRVVKQSAPMIQYGREGFAVSIVLG